MPALLTTSRDFGEVEAVSTLRICFQQDHQLLPLRTMGANAAPAVEQSRSIVGNFVRHGAVEALREMAREQVGIEA